jgi:hypothetical protein
MPQQRMQAMHEPLLKLQEGTRMSDDHKWRNLETKTAEAIDSLMFTENTDFIVSALSRLDEVLRWTQNQPDAARARAEALQPLAPALFAPRLLRAPADFDLGIAAPLAVGARHAWLATMPDDARLILASELTSLLRFVRHRGSA